MTNPIVDSICRHEFKKEPNQTTRQTTGLCNEVYHIDMDDKAFILRFNKFKKNIYGTHRFLPLFRSLGINVPNIVAEDYTKSVVPFHYQILTKLPGNDLLYELENLSFEQIGSLSANISHIIDQFRTLRSDRFFGVITGTQKERFSSQLSIVKHQHDIILSRNRKTNVLSPHSLAILDEIITRHADYFLNAASSLYYDDLVSKNIMIANGYFCGLVDLDYLKQGDVLELIGKIKASWYFKPKGKFYFEAISQLQQLNEVQSYYVNVYSILTLAFWLSETGVQFNSNSSTVIDWVQVDQMNDKIQQLAAGLALRL